MPSSIFDISISGLQVSQAKIATTSQNIANANTEGYSRQRVDQSARLPEFVGGVFFGAGAEITNIKRIVEASHQIEIRSATANFYELQTYLSNAERVDGLLADEANGLNSALQSFFSAAQGVANDPASIPARQVMLSQTDLLISRFKSIYAQLDTQTNEINQSIDATAAQISALANSIAELNNAIAGSPGDITQAPPDLLDQRDVMLGQLAELINVQTVQQSDGSVNVFVGTGNALVVGSLANQIASRVDPEDPKGRALFLTTGTGSSIDVTKNISGGKLGGLLTVNKEIIEPAFNTLGRVALAIADEFNRQQTLGMDLNNDLGSPLFTDINDPAVAGRRVSASVNNTGNAQLSINITNIQELGDANYQLLFSGGNYILIDQTTDTQVMTFPPPVAPATITPPGLGFEINFLSGSSNNGDSFEIQPVKQFPSELNRLINTAEQIAAASPIRFEQSASNIGSGELAAIQVSDTSGAEFTTTPQNLSPPLRFVFTSPTQFEVFDISGAPTSLGVVSGFVPNQDNDLIALAAASIGAPFSSYGYEITLRGEPQVGDSFDATYNNAGFGDNQNIQKMVDIQQRRVLDNGQSSLQEAFGRAIAKVGVNTASAKVNLQAAEGVLFEAKERREAVSGVNLDEEAANLIKFQQAYEASAQVISVARTLFQTILDSIR